MNYLPSLLLLLTGIIIFNCGNRKSRVETAGYYFLGGMALFFIALF
jgi:hypothetical protein